jgi:hypothetical protein
MRIWVGGRWFSVTGILQPASYAPEIDDVTDGAQVTRAVRAAEERFGGVDVLVNNAGYGYRAAVEEGDDADVQRLFAANFFGAVAMIKAVLPGMRARRSGAIVNVSSIGARRTPEGSGYYAAAKAALEGMSGSLRKELAAGHHRDGGRAGRVPHRLLWPFARSVEHGDRRLRRHVERTVHSASTVEPVASNVSGQTPIASPLGSEFS